MQDESTARSNDGIVCLTRLIICLAPIILMPDFIQFVPILPVQSHTDKTLVAEHPVAWRGLD